MVRAGRAPFAAVLVFIVSVHPLAGRALAFASDATAAVASRVATALPAASGWDPAWDGDVAVAVEASAAREEGTPDPEAAALTHRFDALRARNGLAQEPADQVGGLAPFALAEAYVRLEMAFAGNDAAAAIDAAASLTAHATDLADPFQVTTPDPEEGDGVRALWSEASGTAPSPGGPSASDPGDPVAAGMALARVSAAIRPAIEDAAARGDGATIERLRSERLGAASALAGGLMLKAWRNAGSPDLSISTPQGSEGRVRPNPARAGATLAFDSPVVAPATLEVFDLQGRRVSGRTITLSTPGPQRVALDGPGSGTRPVGVYLVRVSVADRVMTGRFIQAR